VCVQRRIELLLCNLDGTVELLMLARGVPAPCS
jgi:hypothetical protein